jgi:FkbH-like protein
MVPVSKVRRWELAGRASSAALNAAGRAAHTLTRDARWLHLTHTVHERLARWIHRRYSAESQPDAFLLEVYNPTPATVQLNLIIEAVDEAARRQKLFKIMPSFRTTLTVPTGYSRHDVDARLFRSITHKHDAFDISLVPESDSEAHLIFLTADFIRFAARPGDEQRRNDVKCIVWDLDNTLWDGVLIEDPDVRLKQEIPELLRYFDERGILLSIASKNDHSTAWRKLEEFGISDFFLHPQINWMPKSESVRRVAESLDIGIDTLAFVDDNPFELEEVAAANPSVLVINTNELAHMTSHARLQGSTTADARARRSFYKQAIVRQQEESRFGADYTTFLSMSSIVLEIAPYHPDELDRIAELVQRTNQLNFSGRKYSRAKLYEILEDPGLEKYVLKCSDKYGSYGTIGFSIVRHESTAIRIEDFMLSCRVQGKFLEQAFFDHLFRDHNPLSARALWVNFHSTERNTPARNVLETIGFSSAGSGPGMLMPDPAVLRCDFIEVRCTKEHHVYGDRDELASTT